MAGCSLFNLPPTAGFALPEQPRPGLEAVFVNTSTDPNGFEDLRQFIWDFGDGGTADSQNAAHVYLQAGTYTARLTVIDSAQHADTEQQDVDVRSRVFAPADSGDAVLGSRLAQVRNRYLVPETARYSPAPGGGPWIVYYPAEEVSPHRFVMMPQNIVGWLPLRFSEDFNQPIELSLRWELCRENGDPVCSYDYPHTIALPGPGLAEGVDLIWDLWGQYEYGYTLAEGRYYTRLAVKDLLSGELFAWHFSFIVDWGST